MRPLNLSLKGFTAFRDEQTIDFADLDLFAIWGPTGSGKSSILDAMTYALFGKIARIEGIQEETNTSLISQGQPRMAVSFEFKVGAEHLKVTRSTPRNGGTKALLEVLEGSDWRSYGEGADSVRQVNKLVPEIIGLDYDAFTRSVILPQGKFAEFLVGDGTKRRKILTELLGLELFALMAARANEIARDAKTAADLSAQLVERDYDGVGEEAVREARARAKATGATAKAAAAVHDTVRELSTRAVRLEAQMSASGRCLDGVSEMAGSFERHSVDLAAQVAAVANSQHRFDDANIALEKARATLGAVDSELAETERKWGRRDEIVRQRERLATLVIARRESVEAQRLREAIAAELAEVVDEVEAGAILVRDAETRLKDANHRHERACKAHDEEHRRDLVGSLVAGLEPGAPCPVCERSLEVIPTSDAGAIDEVAAELDTAKNELRRAEAELATAEANLGATNKAVEASRRNLKRGEKAVAARVKAVEDLELDIATMFEGVLPEDPGAELDGRLRVLEKLTRDTTEARAAVEAALLSSQQCARAADEARAEVTRIRTALESAGLRRLLEDAAAAAPDLELPEVVDSWPVEPEDLVTAARRAAADLGELRKHLQQHREALQGEMTGLVDEARAGIPPELDVEGRDLEEIERSAGAEVQRTNKAATAADHEAVQLKEALSRRRALEDEIASRSEEHALYKALGNELRSDHIVDYLQAEALAALADAGSQQLRALSGGRYRLSYEDDRFFVVDAWNGEERRSVRTLSGGETFLASLALALALADQVQLLAVADRQRLESLFLDEGFGTLDTETLEIVVSAIEQLGGEDRLVGVITHVTELAGRLPVRVHVEKSPRGSRISMNTHASQGPM